MDENSKTGLVLDEKNLKGDERSQRSCEVIPSFDEFDIADYRNSLGMSQTEFAKAHEISVGTLRKWERHSSKPIFNDALKRILNSWLKRSLEPTS